MRCFGGMFWVSLFASVIVDRLYGVGGFLSVKASGFFVCVFFVKWNYLMWMRTGC